MTLFYRELGKDTPGTSSYQKNSQYLRTNSLKMVKKNKEQEVEVEVEQDRQHKNPHKMKKFLEFLYLMQTNKNQLEISWQDNQVDEVIEKKKIDIINVNERFHKIPFTRTEQELRNSQ
ncbi:unnamed protein product [Paramecium octaurelia]|uniref:Uncharacterized protein n=1 Tax=Paramecium octaurelia TaxID=43137 RepID=A0A8S1TLB5_PAROT|nr:unnamed protein product [Paramecium octaurelia]